MSSCPIKTPNVDDSNKTSAQNGQGCPVKSSGTYFGYWSGFIWDSKQKDIANENQPIANNISDCPLGYNSAANDEHFNQSKQDGQKFALSTKRSVSTILKSDYTPNHQPENAEKWVYPSEQQYFNAMKRKGYNPSEQDVPVVLAIHNMVNEKGWSEIKEWEKLHGVESPKLKRFMGRPNDISPKAYLMNMCGYTLPFDRHDWFVERNGKDVRYVIDFYKGKEPTSWKPGTAPIAIYLDVRPALDSFSALYDRIHMSIKKFYIGKVSMPNTDRDKDYSDNNSSGKS